MCWRVGNAMRICWLIIVGSELEKQLSIAKRSILYKPCFICYDTSLCPTIIWCLCRQQGPPFINNPIRNVIWYLAMPCGLLFDKSQPYRLGRWWWERRPELNRREHYLQQWTLQTRKADEGGLVLARKSIKLAANHRMSQWYRPTLEQNKEKAQELKGC